MLRKFVMHLYECDIFAMHSVRPLWTWRSRNLN